MLSVDRFGNAFALNISMAPTRTQSHPPRSLDVALTAADRMWIHSGNNPEPALITRVASEFREMPGLALTIHQAARLFHLGAQECWQVLDQLQRDGVIERTPAGVYRLARE